ncbi:hypothetical protein D3C87_1506440 [compost metagenome]
MLQHPLQNQLAPVALGFLPFQGPGQVGCFIAQAQVQRLQPLQFLGQGETLTGFGLITLLDAFFEGLDAFLQRVQQLPQTLLTGFGKTLLTLVEDFAGQLRKLRTQLVSRALQVTETLLVAFLLLTQLGVERGGLGVQTTQLGFFAGALQIPGVGGIAGVVTLDLQQFHFTAHGGEVRLPGGVGLAQIGDFIAAGFELGVQSILGQMGRGQALFQQGHLRLHRARPAL